MPQKLKEARIKACLVNEMKEMSIEYLSLDEIKPYENNPRYNDNAVDKVAESIKQFGFKVPIVIDENNVIVTGHTRYKASEQLGLTNIPCIRADDLTDDQVKAFRLADNKVSEIAMWDNAKLELEIEDIEIDMSAFGFDLDFGIDDLFKENERTRTNKAYNLDLIDWDELSNDFWQMPVIHNDEFVPDSLIRFNYAKTSKTKDAGIHFYVDDYQFERIWTKPEKYLGLIREFQCMLSPDFSLYMDMPTPMKIWNVYRQRQIGAYYQSQGIKVIPTMQWAEPESYEYCFQGIPKGSIVSISTLGVKGDEDALKVWHDGTDEMIRRIEPSKILVYGGVIEHDYQGIEVIYYKNDALSYWKDNC